MFKNCLPFTSSISRINNSQIDDVHGVDVVMPMYHSIDFSDNFLKISGLLWQYCREEPILAADDTIVDFTESKAITDSFKIKEKITGKTYNDDTEKVNIMVPLK